MGLAPIRFPDLAGPYLGQSVGGGERQCGPSSRVPLPQIVTLGFPALHPLRAQLQDAGVEEAEASKTVPCCGDACAVPAEAS